MCLLVLSNFPILSVEVSSKPISSNKNANLLNHKYILYFLLLFLVLGNGKKLYFYGGIFSADWNWCYSELVYLCDSCVYIYINTLGKYRISPDPTVSIILACQYGAPLSVGFKCHTLFHASVYMLWCSWVYVQSLSQPFSKIFHPSTNLN